MHTAKLYGGKMNLAKKYKYLVFIAIICLSNCFCLSKAEEVAANTPLPNKPVTSDTDIGERHTQIASIYYQKYFLDKDADYLDKSIVKAREAIKHTPDNGQNHLILCYALLAKGEINSNVKRLQESHRELVLALKF